MHGITISEPLIADNTIAFVMDMDITMKKRQRSHMKELCLYQVKEGRLFPKHFLCDKFTRNPAL